MLSYKDQLHIWCLLVRNNLAGKIAPAHPWDRRPTEYAILVPDSFAVAEVNAISDTPITVKHLSSILARFRHLDPPYSSFEPNKAKEHNAKVVAAPASAYGYELVNGVPRWNNGGLSEHLARKSDCRTGTAPWLSEGISRATWYRRQRETRDAPNPI
jgi:hypothetical protein